MDTHRTRQYKPAVLPLVTFKDSARFRRIPAAMLGGPLSKT
jgi:hypothetical protein